MGNKKSKAGARATKAGDSASEVVTVASGADAYKIDLIPENRLGGGQYADVFKILKKDT